MALIKCTECGKDVSDRATACPNCGCPMDAILADQEQQRIEEEKREEERRVEEAKRKDQEALEQARAEQEHKSNSKAIWSLVCIVILAFVIGAISYYTKGNTSTATEAQASATSAPAEPTEPAKQSYSYESSGSHTSSYIDDDMKAALGVYCEKVVSARLKSPSSAKFPLYTKYSYEKGTDNTFSIVGYVDAQNSYGADIRETWGVMVQYDGHTTTLLMVQIGEDIYIP